MVIKILHLKVDHKKAYSLALNEPGIDGGVG